jgi:hypothetical protein
MLSLALASAACGPRRHVGGGEHGEIDPADATQPLPATTGCLQGVVIDGVTGERLPLTVAAGDTVSGIKVLVGSSFLTAAPVASNTDTPQTAGLKGEYLLCGVPLEATFPIIAQLDGYQAFESYVSIDASAMARGGGAEQDRLPAAPTLQANIRMFPNAAIEQPYHLIVTHAGQPLPGARVSLQPTGQHVLTQGDGFLYPIPLSRPSINVTTDDAGVAEFAPGALSLGAIYRYEVLPPDGGEALRAKTGSLVVGYMTSPALPFTTYVDLGLVDMEIVVLSKSTDSESHDPTGNLTFYLNRNVELVPGTEKLITASLTNIVKASLVADVPTNETVEQVTVTIEGTRVTIAPRFRVAPQLKIEPGASISYSGVHLRPVDGKGLTSRAELAGTVSFFGGVASPGRPATVTVVSGNAQPGSAGAALPNPLVVSVQDQYGQLVPNATVTFTPTGGGSVAPTTAVTDASGRAQTVWTLGTTGGQEVTAAVTGATSATFTATFLQPSTMTIVGLGDGQTGVVSNPLTEALVVELRDTNNRIVPNVDVVFTVDQGAGGTIDTITPSAAMTTQTVATGPDGRASVVWTFGATAGSYTVTASATGVTDVVFDGTAVTPVLSIVDGDNQAMAPGGSVLAQPLIVEVRAMGTNALVVNAPVKFETTGGKLRFNALGNELATVTGPTDANGQAKATWRLGSTSGAQTVTVTVPNTAQSVTFHGTAQ